MASINFNPITRIEQYLDAILNSGGGGGGGGGTTNYNDLSNKPKIGGVTLSGNKSLADLGIAAVADIPNSADDVGAVAVSQGVANAGKFAVVGSDGDVTFVTLSAWQGGSY